MVSTETVFKLEGLQFDKHVRFRDQDRSSKSRTMSGHNSLWRKRRFKMSSLVKPPFMENAKLASFTIPIKKKPVEEDVTKEYKLSNLKVDYSDLKVTTIRDIITSTAYNDKQIFPFKSLQLVENPRLERNFSNRKKEFSNAGIPSKESYGFVLLDFDKPEIDFICRNGLAVGSSFLGELGDHEQGVYVSKHPDLVSPSPHFEGLPIKILIVKLLLGRPKEVGLGSCDLDADPAYNSHFVKWPPVIQRARLPRFKLYRLSRLFVYEHDSSMNVVPFPRSVLPYAVVTLHSKSSIYRIHGLGSGNYVWSGTMDFGPDAKYPDCTMLAANRATKPPMPISGLDLSTLVPWCQCVKSPCLSALLSPAYAGAVHRVRELPIKLRDRSMRFVSYYILSNKSSKEFTKTVHAMKTEHLASVYMGPNKAEWFLIPNGELSSDLSLPCFPYAVFHVLVFSPSPNCRPSRLNLPSEKEYTKTGPLLGHRIENTSPLFIEVTAELRKKRPSNVENEAVEEEATNTEEPVPSDDDECNDDTTIKADQDVPKVESDVLILDDEYDPGEPTPSFKMTSEQLYLVRSLPKMNSFPGKKNIRGRRNASPVVREELHPRVPESSSPFSPSPEAYTPPPPSTYIPQAPDCYDRTAPVGPSTPPPDGDEPYASTSNLYTPYEPSLRYSFERPYEDSSGNNGSFRGYEGFGRPSLDLYAYRPSSPEDPVTIPTEPRFFDPPMSTPPSRHPDFSLDIDMRPMLRQPGTMPPPPPPPLFCEASTSHEPPISPWINGPIFETPRLGLIKRECDSAPISHRKRSWEQESPFVAPFGPITERAESYPRRGPPKQSRMDRDNGRPRGNRHFFYR
uniref:DUF3715 domain-containing protein n=1 Tax=Steinernema glaseri TaxID=37863 RepID=A0A1I7ZHF2_9BILA